jgi:hypothetical protein
MQIRASMRYPFAISQSWSTFVGERCLIHAYWLISVLLLVLTLLAFGTLFVDRPIAEPAEVTGSSTAPDYAGNTVADLARGRVMVTREPDGSAYVEYKYQKPEAFAAVVHSYPFEFPPAYRIKQAALQWSDEGSVWTDAARGHGESGYFDFYVHDSGAHPYWRMLVLESGEAPEVAIGPLSFRKQMSVLTLVPVDLIWLSPVPGLLLLFAFSKRGLTPSRLSIAIALPLGLFAIALSIGYAPSHTIVSPDSQGYLSPAVQNAYSEARNSGYATFLLVVSHTLGLAHLPFIQVCIVVMAYVASVAVLAAAYSIRWVVPFAALGLIFQGWLIEYSAMVMTEAMTAAGFVMAAAGLAASARRPSSGFLLFAGLGIVIVTGARSNGIILLIPALLLARFLPRGARLSSLILLVTPVLAVYGAMVVHSHYRTGSLAPESFAGIALAGQVGWMLDGSDVEPKEVTHSILRSVEPTLAKRPRDLFHISSIVELDRYVDYTVNEYNQLIWQDILPVLSRQLWSARQNDAYLLRLSTASISARPEEYFFHVVAHFYGLWRDLGGWNIGGFHTGAIEGLQTASLGFRHIIAQTPAAEIAQSNSLYSSIIPAFPSQMESVAAVTAQAAVPLLAPAVWQFTLDHRIITTCIGVGTLIACLLFFIPGRITTIYRGEIMFSLTIDAYLLSSALFQVTLPRYSLPILSATMLMSLYFVATSICALSGAAISKFKVS